MSEHKYLPCPETGRLHDVELERTSLGVVVSGCNRFPDGVLGCQRGCACIVDRQNRMDAETRERVLFVLANLHDDAAHIASMIVKELAGDGLVVELAELGGRAVPPVADYDAVIVGAHVRFGHHARNVIAYIRDHVGELGATPAFFYSVGGRAAIHRERDARRLTERTGWQPTMSWAFTDATDLQGVEVRAFARLVADEIPPVLQPSFA